MPAAPALPPAVKPTIKPSPSSAPAPQGKPATDADMARFAKDLGFDDAPAPTPEAKPAPEPKAAPAPEPQPEPESSTGFESEIPVAVVDPKPEPRPDDAKPADKAAPAADEHKAPTNAKDLRAGYERISSENKQLKTELEKLRTESAKPKDDTERKALVEQLETERKTRAELESKLAFVDYSESKEFQEQFKAPYESAYKEAWKELKGMTKADGQPLSDAALEQIIFGGEKEAYRLIDESFEAADARLASRLIQDVYGLNRQMNRKLADQKSRAQDVFKQRTAEVAARQEKFKSAWDTATDQIVQKYPQYFGDDKADTARTKLMADGFKYVDAAYNPPQNLTVEQIAFLRADVRQRAGAFPALAQKLIKTEARVKELEGELAKFRRSEPGRGEAAVPAGETDAATDGEEGTLDWSLRQLRKKAS